MVESQFTYSDEKNMYLKSIRKTSLKVFAIIFLINVLSLCSIFVLKQMFKFVAGGSLENISNEMYTYITAYLPCIVSEIILIPVAFCILKNEIDIRWFNIFSNREKFNINSQITSKFKVLSIFSVFGITFIVTLIMSIFFIIIDLVGYELQMTDYDFSGDLIINILATLYVCIIAPILEEIIFRGILLNAFKKYGNMTAILVSSISFAMFHMNPIQIPVAFITGILLAFVTIKTNNIKLALIIHIVNNTGNGLPTTIFGNESKLSYIIVFVLSILGAILLSIYIYSYRKMFADLYITEDRTYSSISIKILHTALSVTFILFTIEWILNNVGFITSYIVKK